MLTRGPAALVLLKTLLGRMQRNNIYLLQHMPRCSSTGIPPSVPGKAPAPGCSLAGVPAPAVLLSAF